MPRIFDRRSGQDLGQLTPQEWMQLKALLDETSDDEVPSPVDPDALERLAESGASQRLISVVQQILQGREDFDIDWED